VIATTKPTGVATAPAPEPSVPGPSRLLLFGAIGLLGVGGFLYIRRRRKAAGC